MNNTQIQKAEGNTLLLSGCLNVATVNKVWQQSQPLFASAGNEFVIDLQKVTDSDSAGVALLVAWVRTARQQAKRLHFLHVPVQMQAIMNVSGLTAILPIK